MLGKSPAQRGFAMQKMIRPTAGAPCRTSAHSRTVIRTRILHSSFFTPYLEKWDENKNFSEPEPCTATPSNSGNGTPVPKSSHLGSPAHAITRQIPSVLIRETSRCGQLRLIAVNCASFLPPPWLRCLFKSISSNRNRWTRLHTPSHGRARWFAPRLCTQTLGSALPAPLRENIQTMKGE